MSLETIFQRQIQENIELNKKLLVNGIDILIEISEALISTLRSGGTIYLFGNGGSAADAQHIATEFVCRFFRDRQALPAISFTANMAVLTAVANDYNFSQVFARQVHAHVRSKDLCVGISTSGRSENVLEGLRATRTLGAKVIGFTGARGDHMKSLCDICFQVPSDNSARIQEAHYLSWHIILDIIEQEFIENPK